MPALSSDPVADAILARIQELARAHGASIRDDAALADLLVALKIDAKVPIAAFAVAADMLFHLLAAERRAVEEAMP